MTSVSLLRIRCIKTDEGSTGVPKSQITQPGKGVSQTYRYSFYKMHIKILFLIGTASAMPGMAVRDPSRVKERQSLPTLPLSSQEGNSGPFPSLQFSPTDQFVDVRPGTTHQFVAPGTNDKRGPCPGLNAAANHGFLPRSGITTITQSKYLFPLLIFRVRTYQWGF